MSNLARRLWLVPALLLQLLDPAAAPAADWPQWRGPTRDGVAAEGALPAELPAELRRLWQVEVGSGHSSPIVSGDRVYIFARQGEEEILRALALGDGRELWRHAEPTSYRLNPAAFRHGKGPKSTPVASGGAVCSFGIAGRLTCHDAESGRVLWQKDFAGRFDRSWPDYGVATSPLVVDDKLIVHVGGLESGALAAFRLADGEEIWSWEGDAPAYASPILVTMDGVEHIVTQSRRYLLSVEAGSGALLFKTPFTTDYEQNIVTPVAYGSRLVFSGLDSGIFSIEAKPDGRGRWLVEEVWRNDELSLYMSSPVLHGDLLFGFSHRRSGQLFCLDARSGEVKWTSGGREGDNGSLIVAGDRLVLLDTEGELSVAPASAEGWKPVATYNVASSPTWAYPALVEGRVLIKDEETLSAWAVE